MQLERRLEPLSNLMHLEKKIEECKNNSNNTVQVFIKSIQIPTNESLKKIRKFHSEAGLGLNESNKEDYLYRIQLIEKISNEVLVLFNNKLEEAEKLQSNIDAASNEYTNYTKKLCGNNKTIYQEFVSKKFENKTVEEKNKILKSPIIVKILKMKEDVKSTENLVSNIASSYISEIKKLSKCQAKKVEKNYVLSTRVEKATTEFLIDNKTGLSRAYLLCDDKVAGKEHVQRRMQLMKVSLEACFEHRHELKDLKLGSQFKAYYKFGSCEKDNDQKVPYEFAHISLIPQISLKNKQGNNIVPGMYCELNPSIPLSKVVGNAEGSVPLTDMLNCTDYMPWYYNAIDDFCEKFLRNDFVEKMEEVIHGKISVNQAYEIMLKKMNKTLTTLQNDLENKNLSQIGNGENSKRFKELLGLKDLTAINETIEVMKNELAGLFKMNQVPKAMN